MKQQVKKELQMDGTNGLTLDIARGLDSVENGVYALNKQQENESKIVEPKIKKEIDSDPESDDYFECMMTKWMFQLDAFKLSGRLVSVEDELNMCKDNNTSRKTNMYGKLSYYCTCGDGDGDKYVNVEMEEKEVGGVPMKHIKVVATVDKYQAMLILCSKNQVKTIKKLMNAKDKMELESKINSVRNGIVFDSFGNNNSIINGKFMINDDENDKFNDLNICLYLNNSKFSNKKYQMKKNTITINKLDTNREYKFQVRISKNGKNKKNNEIRIDKTIRTIARAYDVNDSITFTVGNSRQIRSTNMKYFDLSFDFGESCFKSYSKRHVKSISGKNSFIVMDYSYKVSINGVYFDAHSTESNEFELWCYDTIGCKWIYLSKFSNNHGIDCKTHKVLCHGLVTSKFKFQCKRGQIILQSLSIN